MLLNIYEDFYSNEEFNFVKSVAATSAFVAGHQPNNLKYLNRLKAYPCYETASFTEDHPVLKIFKENFEKKTGYVIKEILSLFRKVLTSELKQSPITKYKMQPHTDRAKWTYAGIVYLNSYSIDDGTLFFSHPSQIEPDIIIGSKPNRCCFYNSQLLHSPNQDFLQEERIVQPFFIKV